MADNTQTPNRSDDSMSREPGKSDKMSQGSNPTMQNDQAKAGGGGHDGGQRQSEQGQSDMKREEKSAIGGGESRSESGEPGRARNELDQNQKSETSGQR